MGAAADNVRDRTVAVLRAGRSVALQGPAGIGKTTTVEHVCVTWSRTQPVHRAAPSLSAREVSLAALAGLVRRDTATIAAAVADLRDLPGLLVVDDADLLDPDSAVVVHTVGRERPVLLSLRGTRDQVPDAVLRLVGEAGTESIPIAPLTVSEAAELMEGHLGGPVDGRSVEQLARVSEGNPLLLRELLVSGLQASSLVSVRGVWTLGEVMASTSVRQVFRERVATWPADVLRVVAAVAVGEEVPLALLRDCFGEAAVGEARLLDAFVIDTAGTGVQVRHALLRDSVIATTDPAERSELLRMLLHRCDTPAGAEVTPLRRGLWLLGLGDHSASDVDALVLGAHLALDSLQTGLAGRLAGVAFRHDPRSSAIEVLVRLGLHDPASTELDLALQVESLTGRFELFTFGLAPLGTLREDVLATAARTDEPGALLQCEVLSAVLDWLVGQPCDRAVAVLPRLAAVDPPSRASVTAAMFATSATQWAGQLLRALDIAQAAVVGDNPLHQAQFAYARAEALLRLGRLDEARVAAARLDALDTETNLAARLFQMSLDADLHLQLGHIGDATRTLGSLVTQLAGSDPVGIGTWAQVWLAATLAWSGRPAADPIDAVASIPEHGGYLRYEIRLARAVYIAEAGRFVEARDAALELADDAEANGYHFTAMWATHLALRVQPSPGLSAMLSAAAQRVDGDVADTVAQHGRALVDDHGPGLEKVARRFVELGYLALAHETYVRAARAFRAGGQRSAAARCASAGERLVEDGCVGTFATRNAPVQSEGLTLREREVAMAVAEGLTHREVADALGIAVRTAETHLHRAYRKLGVTNAAELRVALEREL